MSGEQWTVDNLISLLSLFIGLQNLELNLQQVNALMDEMKTNQNSMLSTIIQQNEKILQLLKEDKKHD